ncbi:MAG: LysO family transporter [Candidatus Cryptobacteroides sp.]
MFSVIAIMFAGVLLGWLLKGKDFLKHIPTGTMVTIVLLLFVMGVEIGSNRTIVDNILNLGTEALLISMAATLGSILAASGVFLLIKRRHSGNMQADNEK